MRGKMNMKITRIVFAASVGLISLSANLLAQPVSGSQVLPKNKAVLSSPRTLEEFPELLRAAQLREGAIAKAESRTERLARLTENRGLAVSPRFREEHPELLRPQPSLEQLA